MIWAGVLEGDARCASPAELGTGADALQFTLLFSFRARLTASVGLTNATLSGDSNNH